MGLCNILSVPLELERFGIGRNISIQEAWLHSMFRRARCGDSIYKRNVKVTETKLEQEFVSEMVVRYKHEGVVEASGLLKSVDVEYQCNKMVRDGLAGFSCWKIEREDNIGCCKRCDSIRNKEMHFCGHVQYFWDICVHFRISMAKGV